MKNWEELRVGDLVKLSANVEISNSYNWWEYLDQPSLPVKERPAHLKVMRASGAVAYIRHNECNQNVKLVAHLT